MTLYDRFIDWIMENYPIGNGDMLVDKLECGDTQSKFLRDIGLDEDTEITDE